MYAKDHKVQAQRKEKEEREEKEAQRKAATVKVAKESAMNLKARDVKKESVEGLKKQPKGSKEEVEGSKKPMDAPKEALSGVFGVGALVASLGELSAKASGSSNTEDSGGKTVVSPHQMWVPMHHLIEGYKGWLHQDYHRFLSC